LNSSTIFGATWSQILTVATVALAAFILERVITRYLRRFAKRARLEPNVTNSLVLTFRILILIGAVASIVRVGGLTTEWFVAFSALGGAAVGFASQQTIGNFVAGLYLLATRPFKAGDYVRVGTVDGIVQEITINYTKILTMGNNIASLTNLQRDITNYLYENEHACSLYCYTFEVGFDHSVSTEKLAEIFNEVFKRHSHAFPKELSYTLVRSSACDRV